MKIANPIYDSVFKLLMENQAIARGLISRLLGVKVLSLKLQAQEMTQRHAQLIGSDERVVRVFRVDFAAEVKLTNGRKQKVLIELQKAREGDVVGRFRGYLGGHYGKKAEAEAPLPIIAIYLLGFTLNKALPKVLKVKRQYLDGVTGNALPVGMHEPFVEMLTHDAVIVQIPLLNDSDETEIERALLVFNQRYKTENEHYLEIDNETWSDPLVNAMIRELLVAASDEKTREEMKMEDELSGHYERMAKNDAAIKKANEKHRRQIAEERRQKEEAIKKQEEERRQKEEAVKKQKEAERRVAELEAMVKKLKGK